MGKIAKEKGMNNNDKSWDYYFPCEYNTCEERVQKFETEVNEAKKIFLIDGCDWPASKIALWKLLKEYYGNKNASKLMPQTYLLDEEQDLKEIKTHFENNKKIRNNFMYILKNYAQRQEGLKIVQTYEDIMDGYNNGFYLVQDYLYNPFLIEKRKVNFRYYTLIVCRKGKVEGYIHDDGLVERLSDEKNFPSDILTDCEKIIFEKTGYTLKLSIKKLETTFILPKTIIVPEDETYDYVKAKFELEHFKCMSESTFYNMKNDRVITRDKSKLLVVYENLFYTDISKKTGPFLPLLEKSVTFFNSFFPSGSVTVIESLLIGSTIDLPSIC
jgi:hypothetical protein